MDSPRVGGVCVTERLTAAAISGFVVRLWGMYRERRALPAGAFVEPADWVAAESAFDARGHIGRSTGMAGMKGGMCAMRFGICSKPEQAEALFRLGYDYVEWPVAPLLGKLSDEGFRELRTKTESLKIRPETWNILLPAAIKVVGPQADRETLRTYLTTVLARAAALGGRIVVFGSGRSRQIPEGWAYEDAVNQFIEASVIAGDIAAQHGMTIVLEPLNKEESNFLNSVEEGIELVKRINHPSVKLLSDLYHVAAENEPFDHTKSAGGDLAHVHVATPGERQLPIPGRDEEVFERFFRALRAAGYQGRISFEGKWTMDEAARGLETMRAVWKRVSQEV